MALFSECRPQCAQTVLDTADIVREAMCPCSFSSTRTRLLARGPVTIFALHLQQTVLVAHHPVFTDGGSRKRCFNVSANWT